MNLFSHPFWLIILPIGMAFVVFVVRRQRRLAGLLTALTTLVTARLCLSMPFNWSIELQGRTMMLEAPNRLLLGSAFLLVTLYFVYAIFVYQERSFFSLILIVMSLFSAAAMIDSVIIAVLILEMAAMIIVLLIQAGRNQSIKGSMHYLGSMVIAVIPLLLTAHLIELRILNPTDKTLPQIAAFLLVLGMTVFLGAVPFQAWSYAISIEASPIINAFIFSAAHSVVIFKLFELLHRFPWLIADGNILGLMLIVGLGSLILGSAFAVFQRDFGKLLAWAILFDIGFLFIGLSSVPVGGLSILTLLLLNRVVAVTLLGMGMTILRAERGDNLFLSMKGVMWQNPIATLSIAIGGLSLAGFPLTGGFTARWLVIQELPVEIQRWALLLLIAGAAVSIGYLRGIALMVGQSENEARGPKSAIIGVTMLLLLMVQMALALYPQIFLNPITLVMTAWGIPR